MERALLDTDILSEILKGRNALVMRRAADYATSHNRFTFTTVSVLEVHYGLHHKGAERQLLDDETAFARNEVILPTLGDYENAGRVRGRARGQGRQLTTDDCLIGAVADRLRLP